MIGSRRAVLVTMAAAALLAAAANLLLRHAMAAVASEAGGAGAGLLVAGLAEPLVLAGLVGYGASHLLWLNVLSRARLGALFPLFVGATFVLVVAGSVLVLGEPLPAARLAGAVLVASGMVVSEWQGRAEAGEGTP